MPDLHEKAATLARWKNPKGKWGAELWRNYAGAFILSETKNGRSIGAITRPKGFFPDDAAALAWARAAVPQAFDVKMVEVQEPSL